MECLSAAAILIAIVVLLLTQRRAGERALTVALLLAAGAAEAEVEGFHFTREVEVAAPGRVRVPLDLAALQHLAPGAADLHVFAPSGGEVPLRVEAWVPRTEARPVRAAEVAEEEGGPAVVFDVGPAAAPHERLAFDIPRTAAVPVLRLEGSADGEAWHPLAAGDLVRLGTAGDLQRLALSYPATRDRFLRLPWPRGGGSPRVTAAEVETVAGPSVEVTTRDVPCEAAEPGPVVCAIALPAPGQILRRLTLEVGGEGRVGFRLYEPRQARWRPLAEGVWQRAGERTSHVLPGPAEPVAGTALRLELSGAPDAAPRLASFRVDLAVQTVLFQAGEPGRYVLAYGGAARAASPREEPPAGPADVKAAWVEAGPERVHAPPPLPVSATAPGLPLRTGAAAPFSWRVLAAAAQPGDLVRLELPDVVYPVARSDLGDLRLVVGERQIPFFRWSPPAPVLAAAEGDLRPAATASGSRESQVEIHLPEPGLPLTALHLTAPPTPFRRTVGVRYLEPARTLRERAEGGDPEPVARDVWRCGPRPPLPCRRELPLPGPAPVLLSVRFHDGDNPPLAGLAAAAWRRSDVLLFVWPETEEAAPVRLLAGARELRAPSYDLETLEDVLLGRPWQPAELDLEGTASPEGEAWWSRWVMPATLVVAAAFLLALLRRILAEV
jgi:hypothetical protein